MGKEKLDHIDESKIDDVVTNSLKMAVTDLIISRYASESQTYVVTKDAMSVEEAADDLIDYARHMSSGKYMYAILAGIDKEFTHACVEDFIRNSPTIMEQIRSNVAAGNLKHSEDSTEIDSPTEVLSDDIKLSDGIVDLETDDGIFVDSTEQVDIGPESEMIPKTTNFKFDPSQPNGIVWED